jgi:hypothetical protein
VTDPEDPIVVEAEHVGPPVDETNDLFTRLPTAHQDLLKRLNGFSLHGGAFRVFGIREEPYLDIEQWNSEDLWRYAWSKPLDGWLMIGENALGSQYAYQVDGGGDLGGAVYCLDPIELVGDRFFDDVAEFIDDCVRRMAEEVFDPELKQATERYGPLDPSELLVFAPAEAIGGPHDLDNVQKLPAVTAMTFGGDIYRQIDEHPTVDPTEVRPYTDDQGRDRLELVYDE